jgi:hypothetical protein
VNDAELDTRQLTNSTLSDYRAWVGESHGIIAIDTETTGLDTRAPGFDIVLLSIGANDGTAWVVDGQDAGLVSSSLAALAGRQVWAHNAGYDAAAIEVVYGIRLSLLRDSLSLIASLDPDLIGQLSLKQLRPETQAVLDRLAAHWQASSGEPAPAGLSHEWLPRAVSRLPANDPLLLAYAATDAVACARLVSDARDESTPEERVAALRDTTIEQLWRYPAMRGYIIDQASLAEQIRTVAIARSNAVQRFGLDLSTNTHATRAWLAERGIEVTDESGIPTLSHKRYSTALVPSAAAEDWAGFVDLREALQINNKLSELQRFSARTGSVHPRINANGAKTGRQSITTPALQNLPGGLRGLLVAKPGSILVGCDLNHVEPSIAAALSGDIAMIAAVQPGRDLYIDLAESIWGEAVQKDDPRRKIAKTALLAQCYGQGDQGLALRMGIPLDEAHEITSRLRSAWPDFGKWIHDVRAAAGNGKIMRTFDGRRLPHHNKGAYQAVNYIIQGTAADVFKEHTIQVDQLLRSAGLPDSLWLGIHDELIVQVPEGAEAVALAALKDGMSSTLNGVPLDGTAMVLGQAWAHA